MNTREAMQALLDGKKVTRSRWSGIRFKYLDAEGVLRNDVGEHSELCNFNDYELYGEPNPHAKGTFAWAREEASRGKKVARKAWSSRCWVFVDHGVFSLEDIDATDWALQS